MSLSQGRDLFMTPGPSVIPDRVLNAMHRAAPNIYEGDLIETTEGILDNLRKVARTTGDPTIYISNGHGVWEAALHNVLQAGDKVLCLTTGIFGNGWANVATAMGIEVQLMDFGTGSSFDAAEVAKILRADTGEIKAVLATHTDTSSSVSNDIEALRKAIDETGHHALLMVDCIASLGCEPFEMDAWGVDVMVAGCQKGLMVPPGVAFTFHNNKAVQASENTKKTSPYWNWTPRTNPDIFYMRFNGTPPTHHLFGLDEALKMLVDEEGIQNVWARHSKQARAVWAAVDKWAEAGAIRCNVSDIADRSSAVTTVVSDTVDLTPLHRWCQDTAGLVLGLGIGFGDYEPHQIFRIGHMGHMNPVMLLGALSTIEAGMAALQIPHGEGALTAAGRVLSS
ncbi:MAG: aminotransferase [Rhodobacteraceae bacterium]|nr:MAG: aminotransferase [Paracoccaceae bacterium]